MVQSSYSDQTTCENELLQGETVQSGGQAEDGPLVSYAHPGHIGSRLGRHAVLQIFWVHFDWFARLQLNSSVVCEASWHKVLRLSGLKPEGLVPP